MDSVPPKTTDAERQAILERPIKAFTQVETGRDRFNAFLGFYTRECYRGDVGYVRAERSECENTRNIYAQKLEWLQKRDERLPLVREQCEHKYDEYEEHFKTKVDEMNITIQAADVAIQRWEMDH